MFLDKLKRSYFACLSILTLSICSLMLLPIEGDCEWTTSNNGYSSFSASYSEGHGGGWSLSGSVSANASCASASMSPSISNATAFNGAFGERVADYTGSGTATASREECTDRVPCKFWHCSGYWAKIPAETKTDDNTFLQAWVTMVKVKYVEVTGVAITSPSLTLTIKVTPGDGAAEIGATWTSGGTTYETQSKVETEEIIPKAKPATEVHSLSVGPESFNKSASIKCFSFDGNSYARADASYTAP